MAGPWWGSFELAEGEVRRWRIGPLRLLVERGAREWRLAHDQGDDPLDVQAEAGVAASAQDLEEVEHRLRVPWSGNGTLVVGARLADRNMVFHPEVKLKVPPGDRVELYVSSPLWVELSAGASLKALLEVPSYRPTDTWLGSSTVQGELCYASRTHCRLQLADIPDRPHRAITTVRVCNRSDEAFALDRMSVPLPNLSLYADERARLWTSAVDLTREPDEDLASMNIDPEPPGAGRSEQLAPPRREPEEGGLVRAFAGLL